MKAITALLLLAATQCCLAGGDTDIIAVSDWSKPVGTSNLQVLCARMLVARGHSPGHAGAWPETQLYLEFQNASAAASGPLRFYFDPGRGLHCEVLDASGKPPPSVGMRGSGAGPGACWITLPHDSTIRLRANMYGYGLGAEEGLLIVLSPPTMQNWTIHPRDTNVYFMSGKFTVAARAEDATSSGETCSTWTGTLDLPKLRLSLPKR